MSQRQYELQRVPRRPLPGSPSSSIRSRSIPSKKASQSKLKHGAGPSLTVESPLPDSSSQKTAVNSETYKIHHTEVLYDPPPSPLSARVNSDESGNSGTSGLSGASGDTSHTSATPLAEDDGWNERNVVVPRSNLTVLDVAALILNKMVGTGIFTTPGSVLMVTKSKGMSVALWTVGGLWTMLFLCVYLEFGNALPFNGGELVYLDEIYRRPELLATILFSGFFLCLGNSYGNAIQFAKHVLISANSEVAFAAELDPRLVRFVAISAVTLVCLIHYFSSKAGLFLNKLLAWYKTILLLVVAIAGFAYSGEHGSQFNDKTQPPRGSSMEGLAAMVLIFYSYQGWENANYVAGEIRTLESRTPSRTLKTGAFLAVGVVWVLYVLVTVAYYKVLDFATITNNQTDLGVALHFAPKVFGSSLGMKICMVISALGNVVAVTYTSSKVKQTIAIQRILPFWQFLTQDDETPKGALVLHWVSSVLMIALCPVTSDGYSFAIALYTYGQVFFSVFVAMGLYSLKSRMREQYANYRLTIFRWNWVLYTLPIIFALGNVLVLVTAALEHDPGKIPRFWWLVTIVLILFGSFLYWGVMRITRAVVIWKGEERTIGEIIGFEVIVFNKGDKDLPVDVKDSIAEALTAKIDGSKRRVKVVTSGKTEEVWRRLTKIKDFFANWLF